jgi:hypothetical protein
MLDRDKHQFAVSNYLYGLGNFRFRPTSTPTAFGSVDELEKVDSWFGTLTLNKVSAEVLLQIEDWNFTELPRFYLRYPLPKDLNEIRKWAHFGPIIENLEGVSYLSVCYSLADANDLPRYEPVKVVKWVIGQVIRLIDSTINDNKYRENELLREVEANWNHLRLLYRSRNQDSIFSKLTLMLDCIPTENICIVPLGYRINAVDKIKQEIIKTVILKISKVSLSKLHYLFDRLYGSESKLNLQDFLFFLSSVNRNARDTFIELFGANLHFFCKYCFLPVCVILDGHPISMILSVRPNLLVRDDFGQLIKELRGICAPKKSLEIEFHIINTINVSPDFIYKRNINHIHSGSLEGKKIAVVGCGAIGGYLALSLGRLGAGSKGGLLTLIDPDRIGEHNIGRHALGQRFIDANKAEAIKYELSSQLVGLRIESISKSVFSDECNDLFNHDLIIDATAKTGVSETINELFFAKSVNPKPTLMHIWIRGNGQAVQGLIVTGDGVNACRTCINQAGTKLPPEFDALQGYEEKHAFIACNDYTPYAVSASLSAAALGTDMVLGWAEGNLSPMYRTRYSEAWTGTKISSFDAKKRSDCLVCNAKEIVK